MLKILKVWVEIISFKSWFEIFKYYLILVDEIVRNNSYVLYINIIIVNNDVLYLFMVFFSEILVD